ncbi:MAG: hypothetical protein N0C88_03580 [Candidatus Thiodiazotropha lotti]|uniref:Uncharacterized protein n=1 Tax=Candidatus Thiodiazotropha lotti TaxID=2792787 RepID=A0A9E4MXZ3_9GAMM|nr:hypothetical protein [Candidatus Thiodiazotropha lotti]MCG7937922.1 hypothetical protein [Candidatus Thiodiazotropha lotti]MCW4202390.1 hypothetical protein [Candidatus Thiodiazotropha lotti]
MTDSAGSVGGGDSAGSMGGGSDIGGSDSNSSMGGDLSGGASLSDSMTTGEQLAGSPTTEDGLKGSQTALGSALGSPTTAEALADHQATPTQAKPAEVDHSKIDTAASIAGTVTTVSTSTVTAVAVGLKQNAIQQPVEHAIGRLEASKDPAQMTQAEALREANRPGGLKGALHPDAVEYDVDKTLAARNQVLSDKSVIGNKLTNDLNKASKTIDMAESVAKKAGIVGTVAGPVIGSISEVAKLDENATTAEQITAGIVGAVKNVDNAVVGGVVGTVAGGLTSVTGPGAVATGLAAGFVADEMYQKAGADKQFDDFVDNSVAPVVQSGIEAGLDIVDSTVEFSSQLVNDIQQTASGYHNNLFGENDGSVRP